MLNIIVVKAQKDTETQGETSNAAWGWCKGLGKASWREVYLRHGMSRNRLKKERWREEEKEESSSQQERVFQLFFFLMGASYFIEMKSPSVTWFYPSSSLHQHRHSQFFCSFSDEVVSRVLTVQ